MIQRFVRAGYRELDTAYIYNDGKTETLLGSILPDDTMPLATKVHPKVTGKLDGRAVTMQLEASLQRLGRETVDLLYLHMPDSQTPVEEALKRCAELYEQGKFRELGLSNFPAWMVMHIWHLCDKHGWPKPVVYQGMYNGLSRRPEAELFPALRTLGIRFYAYNPLAGGMLAGKHRHFEMKPSDGRFTIIPAYQERYWKRSIFTALDALTARSKKQISNLRKRRSVGSSTTHSSTRVRVTGSSSAPLLSSNSIRTSPRCRRGHSRRNYYARLMKPGRRLNRRVRSIFGFTHQRQDEPAYQAMQPGRALAPFPGIGYFFDMVCVRTVHDGVRSPDRVFVMMMSEQ